MTAHPQNGNGEKRLQFGLSLGNFVFAGAIFVGLLIGGIMGLVTLMLGPMSTRSEINQHDIDSLKTEMQSLREQVTQAHTDILTTAARNDQKFAEVETQFHALDQVINMRAAEDLRWRCKVDDKLFTLKCSDIFFPPQIAPVPNR